MVEARNFAYMFYGFLAAWMILMAYVVTLVARERRLKKELAQLKSMLDDRTR
jgi:CcmD family protein